MSKGRNSRRRVRAKYLKANERVTRFNNWQLASAYASRPLSNPKDLVRFIQLFSSLHSLSIAGDKNSLNDIEKKAFTFSTGITQNNEIYSPTSQPILINQNTKEEIKLHPGTLQYPMNQFESLLMTAKVIDKTLDKTLEFALSDLIELICLHSTLLINNISSSWNSPLNLDEVERYTEYSLLSTTLLCSYPDKAKLALEWATTESSPEWAYRMGDPDSYGALRVKIDDCLFDTPLALLLESLCNSAKKLARIAASKNPNLPSEFNLHCAANITDEVKKLKHPVDFEENSVIKVDFSQTKALKFIVVSCLNSKQTFTQVQKALRLGKATFDWIAIGNPEAGSTRSAYIKDSHNHLKLIGSINDVKTIISSLENPDDLYRFYEDCIKTYKHHSPLASLLNLWDAWSVDKNFSFPTGTSLVIYDEGEHSQWPPYSPPKIEPNPIALQRSAGARAKKAISVKFERQESILDGEEAIQFYRKFYIPAALELIQTLLQNYKRTELLSFGLKELDLIAQNRLLKKGQLTPEDLQAERVTSIALELALINAPQDKGQTPGNIEWQDYRALVAQWLSAIQIERLVSLGVERIEIHKNHLGQLQEKVFAIKGDIRSFMQTNLKANLNPHNSPPFSEKISFLPISTPVPTCPEWEQVETAFTEQLSFSLGELFEVAQALSEENGGSVLKAVLSSNIEAKTQIAKSKVNAILNFLSISKATLEGEFYDAERYDDREYRVHSRPLIEENGSFFFSSAWCRIFILLLLAYLTEGRVPWPTNTIGTNMQNKLNTYRNVLGEVTENETEQEIKKLGWEYHKNVKMPGGKIGMKGLPGELDFISFDDKNKRIVIFEVKDLAQVYSSYRILDGVHKFTEDKGYFSKIAKKESSIVSQKKSILSQCAKGANSEEWSVESFVISRNPSPAKFFSPAFKMLTIFEISDFF